jgi:hypothetical protein
MNRQQELLKLARKELRQGQHCIGCALWFVKSKTIPPEGLRKQAVVELVKAVGHLSEAAEILLDEHEEIQK